MRKKLSITAIICTYNEEIHLERCIKSLLSVVEDINIIDSFSTDKTKDIALKYNTNYYLKEWTTFSDKFNWALSNTKINTDWVLRIDADEYLTSPLIENLFAKLSNIETSTTAIRVNRLMYFMGGGLKFGGMNPIYHIKLWRKGSAICEAKWMDERMKVLYGDVITIKCNIIDNNLNNISWWSDKHNNYATKEAIDILLLKNHYKTENQLYLLFSNKSENRRKWFKIQYLKLPIFVRPFLFFIIRYFFQGAFLEGKRGFVWTFLQCLWYRLLVDLKIHEANKYIKTNKISLEEYFLKEYKIDINLIKPDFENN
jgi:glycosyltransferase involved in cell wall biosynthesis